MDEASDRRCVPVRSIPCWRGHIEPSCSIHQYISLSVPPFSDTPVNKPCMSTVPAPTCTSDRCLGYEWISLRANTHRNPRWSELSSICHQCTCARPHKGWLTKWTYSGAHLWVYLMGTRVPHDKKYVYQRVHALKWWGQVKVSTRG
jgi:hypothetical protein